MDRENMVTIVGFGDSITLACRQPEDKRWLNVFGDMLEQRFPDRSFRTINAGAGGNTSREGLARLATDVLPHSPDWVLVQFGGNDATTDAKRHVSCEEFRANLQAIKSRVQEATDARIAVLTFPPVIDDWHGWGHDEFYRQWGGCDGCIEEYRKIARDFARQESLPLVDLNRAIREAARENGNEKYILPDGVHLTEDGNLAVAHEVFGVLCGRMQADPANR